MWSVQIYIYIEIQIHIDMYIYKKIYVYVEIIHIYICESIAMKWIKHSLKGV